MNPIGKLASAAVLVSGMCLTATGLTIGEVDQTFDARLTEVGGPPTWPGIVDMALAPDSRIYIGGHGFSANGVRQNGLARLNPDGSWDPAFRAQPLAEIGNDAHQLFLQPDGKIWAGWSSFYRYLATGEFDSEINKRVSPTLSGLSLVGIQNDGKLLVGDGPLRRFNADGILDDSFKSPADERVPNFGFGALELRDGKIMVVGDGKILRLYPNGALDTSFGPTKADPDEIAVDPQSEKTYLYGVYTSVDGNKSTGLMRLNTDGTLDSSFAPSPDLKLQSAGAPTQIALQRDGKAIVGHNFIGLDPNRLTGRLLRLNIDGTLDAILAFDPGQSQTGPIYQILVQPDNKILVCGDFKTVNEIPRSGIVRLQITNSTPSLLLNIVPHRTAVLMHLTIRGPANALVIIEATDDLFSRQWKTLSTNRLDAAGMILGETNAKPDSMRFYRARLDLR